MENPTEKVSRSSTEIVNAMEQRDTLSEKSDDILIEGKLSADTFTNIIPIRIFSKQKYRYKEFERSGRLFRNDSKCIAITFILIFEVKFMITRFVSKHR